MSETATAFKPPKIAYNEPIIPIDHTVIHRAVVFETPNKEGKSNILLMANAPEYNTMGNKTIA